MKEIQMSKFKAIAGGLLIAAVSASFAAADSFTKYGEVEGWKVFVDNDKGSCLIERFDEAGNVVQMGLTKGNQKLGYLGVFTLADIGIRKGKKERVSIDIDGNRYWGDATGMNGNITEGYVGGYIRANNPQFISDVAKKYTMTVFPETEATFTVDLKGTYKAMEMGRKCNAEQTG